jgi:hypothetical protein
LGPRPVPEKEWMFSIQPAKPAGGEVRPPVQADELLKTTPDLVGVHGEYPFTAKEIRAPGRASDELALRNGVAARQAGGCTQDV